MKMLSWDRDLLPMLLLLLEKKRKGLIKADYEPQEMKTNVYAQHSLPDIPQKECRKAYVLTQNTVLKIWSENIKSSMHPFNTYTYATCKFWSKKSIWKDIHQNVNAISLCRMVLGGEGFLFSTYVLLCNFNSLYCEHLFSIKQFHCNIIYILYSSPI